jgi:type II secretory ATPase GspE/PulE/Tfp pilus assembly ATPase PilB-like protein
MRQNPKWILLSEVRSAEAVMAVRNSISSGHYILSTIHADKAASIPNRMYSLLETNQDIEQFLKSIYRYIQIGVYIRGYQDRETKRFVREIAEVCEFHVTENNDAVYNQIYLKSTTGNVIRKKPSKYLVAYLDGQGVTLDPDEIKDTSEEGNRGIQSFEDFVSETKENENNTPSSETKKEENTSTSSVEQTAEAPKVAASTTEPAPLEKPKQTVITATETLEDDSSSEAGVETLSFE